MIITCVSHGRTARDAQNLAAHLSKTVGQRVRVLAAEGLTPALTIADADRFDPADDIGEGSSFSGPPP